MPTRRFAFAAALLLGSAALAPAQPSSTRSDEQPVPGGAQPRFLDLTAAPPRVTRGATTAPISLSVKNADLVEVVRSLVRIAGLNLVVDPSVRGTVTAELRDVPWDRALAVILKTNGLAMELDGRIVTVATPARLYATP